MPFSTCVGDVGSTSLAINSEQDCIAVAGRNCFTIFKIEEDAFVEQINLRTAPRMSLHYSCNSVAWSPHNSAILATAATSGAVAIWNLERTEESKEERMFTEHRRAATKVTFHPNESQILLSCSQDSHIKLYDFRSNGVMADYSVGESSVYDIDFRPSNTNQFSSVSDNGRVALWDRRRPDKPERAWAAHNDCIFTCRWHPQISECLATGGRDKALKLWKVDDGSLPKIDTIIFSIGLVNRVRWRPNSSVQLATGSFSTEQSVNLWDVRRPFVPHAIFGNSSDSNVDLGWKGDNSLITLCRDGHLVHRLVSESVKPADTANTVALSFSVTGSIACAVRDNSTKPMATKTTAVTGSRSNMQGLFNFLLDADNQPPTPPPTPHVTKSNSGPSYSGQAATAMTAVVSLTSPITKLSPVERFKRLSPDKMRRSPDKARSSPELKKTNKASTPRKMSVDYEPFPSIHSKLVKHSFSMSSDAASSMRDEDELEDEEDRAEDAAAIIEDNEDMKNFTKSLCDFTSNKDFIVLANSYVLEETEAYNNLNRLCLHNSRVAIKQGLLQTSQSWRIINSLYTKGLNYAQAGRMAAQGDRPALPNDTADEDYLDEVDDDLDVSRRRRNTSVSRLARSRMPSSHGGGTATPQEAAIAPLTGTAAAAGAYMAAQDAKSGSLPAPQNGAQVESEEESDPHFDNELTLTHIAAGDGLSGDVPEEFFQTEIGNVFGLESFFAQDQIPPNGVDVRSEAFNINHGLNMAHNSTAHPVALDGPLQPPLQPEPDEGDDDDDDDDGPPLLCITTSNVHPVPEWSPGHVVREMLFQTVDDGDLQFAVSMYLVLGKERRDALDIDKDTVLLWFIEYLELLRRFRLYTAATKISMLCPYPEDLALHLNMFDEGSPGTRLMYYSNCAVCLKAMNHEAGGWYCKGCKVVRNGCSVCKKVVKGLMVWCQGCGHGGHVGHMRKWFYNHYACPTGCGHLCQFQ